MFLEQPLAFLTYVLSAWIGNKIFDFTLSNAINHIIYIKTLPNLYHLISYSDIGQ